MKHPQGSVKEAYTVFDVSIPFQKWNFREDRRKCLFLSILLLFLPVFRMISWYRDKAFNAEYKKRSDRMILEKF